MVAHSNNFNLVRFTAALAVVVSHSWPLSLGNIVPDPVAPLFGFSLGSAAVKVFFAVSGFLIYQSWERSNLARFALARFLRIWPALFVVSFVTAFIVGPLLTTEARYFDLQTLAFVPLSVMVLPPDFLPLLPGVFETTPHAGPAGTQWTLHFEVVCYAILALAALLSRGPFLIFAVGVVAVHLIYPTNYTALGLPFLMGACIARYRLPLARSAFMAVLLFSAACYAVGQFQTESASLAIGYGALLFGNQTTPGLSEFNRLGDYSYGIYLWGWPIQQMLAESGIRDPYFMMLFAIPLSITAGALSWRFVERPAMALRRSPLSPKDENLAPGKVPAARR